MYGENIMKYFRIVLLLSLAFVFMVCSNKEEAKIEAKKNIPKNDDEAAITAMMNEYFDRVMEGDKTVLYENEFPYYTDEHPLDEYMAFNQVLNYKYDTLAAVDVDTIMVLGDSAIVGVNVHYASKDGTDKERRYPLKVYRCYGRWMRPYLSHWKDEAEYEEQIRQYDSAVAAEEKGK